MRNLSSFFRKPLGLALIAVALILAWLAFRPDLLFVNKSVDEPFPSATHAFVTPPARAVTFRPAARLS